MNGIYTVREQIEDAISVLDEIFNKGGISWDDYLALSDAIETIGVPE